MECATLAVCIIPIGIKKSDMVRVLNQPKRMEYCFGCVTIPWTADFLIPIGITPAKSLECATLAVCIIPIGIKKSDMVRVLNQPKRMEYCFGCVTIPWTADFLIPIGI